MGFMTGIVDSHEEGIFSHSFRESAALEGIPYGPFDAREQEGYPALFESSMNVHEGVDG